MTRVVPVHPQRPKNADAEPNGLCETLMRGSHSILGWGATVRSSRDGRWSPTVGCPQSAFASAVTLARDGRDPACRDENANDRNLTLGDLNFNLTAGRSAHGSTAKSRVESDGNSGPVRAGGHAWVEQPFSSALHELAHRDASAEVN